MAVSKPPSTDGSKEDGPSFFDRFRAAHGVPVSDTIAAGTVGPRTGGLGADADRNRPRPGRGNFITSFLCLHPSIAANLWTASGCLMF